jgi:hypothetical protein
MNVIRYFIVPPWLRAARVAAFTLTTNRACKDRQPMASIGKVGIWRVHRHGAGGVRELEELGYGALWLGGSPAPADARPFLEATGALTVATGILNVWRHDPAEVAREHAALNEEFGGRFLLGLQTIQGKHDHTQENTGRECHTALYLRQSYHVSLTDDWQSDEEYDKITQRRKYYA